MIYAKCDAHVLKVGQPFIWGKRNFNDEEKYGGLLRNEGLELQDTASSGQEKEAKVFTFYRMEEEDEYYFTPCYGEKWRKSSEKRVLVSLKGEFYFVKFKVNPKEDDVEPNVVLGRSFMRLTKGITDFGNVVITIHPELNPFLDNSEEIEKKEQEEQEKSTRDFQLYYSDVGPLLSNGKPLTQEEASQEALDIDICKRFSIVEEERPVIETIAYSDNLDMPIDRDAPILVGRGFLYTCGSIINTRDRNTSTFDGVFHYTFRAAKTSLNTEKSDNDDEDYGIQRNIFRASINLSKQIYSPFIIDWNVLNTIGWDNAIDMLEVRVNQMGSDEVLFKSKAWKHTFNINETIYTELCQEFYAAFKFNEVVANDDLMTKKAIKLVNVEYGFETYFIGGLRNDDDFSADQYWLNISSEETLTFSRSSAKTIRKLVLRVLRKMIAYGLCQRTTGYDKLLGWIHHNKAQIHLMVDPWVAPPDKCCPSCLGQHLNFKEESIDSGFATFNTIINSLKAFDQGFSSKNYVRKFLRALHPKWRAKVTKIVELKDLSSLALEELIGNLKVHEVVMEKDSKIYKGKKEKIKSIALKAKKESSDDEISTSRSGDEEYAMVVRNFKKFFRRKELNERIKKHERSKEIEITCKSCKELKLENAKLKETQVKFVKFAKSANSLREMINNQKSPSCKIGLGFNSGKASTSGTKTMSFIGSSAEKEMDGSTIKVHGSTLPGSVCLRTYLELDEWIKDSGCSKHMTGNKSLFSTYKAYDGGNVVFRSNLKGKIIGKGPKNVNEALKDESWVVAMQEELNQFVANYVWELVPLPISQSVIGTKWAFKNKLDENDIVSRNKARLVALDILNKKMDVKTTLLNGFINEEVYVAQPPRRNIFNQSKFIKEKLKKFRLEDSKPTKIPISTEIKLTKEDEADSMDRSKYRGMIGSLLYLTANRLDIMFSVCLCARFQENPKTTHLEAVKHIFRSIRGTSHLGSWYLKGAEIETILYADSDHVGGYIDRKSTSGVCTFKGCCLTSWFAKKQTALAISMTKAEYDFAKKACQQAL
nr:hypothetical protein [Tanacetum cinerariifolium]